MSIAANIQLSEPALRMIVELAQLKSECERWSADTTAMARLTAISSRRHYESQIKPVLTHYRDIKLVGTLMEATEQALKQAP